ncbi:nucleotidyltransferase family protein [Arthrobacter castelli]|uniref:nucleotidyltransferase family protein n=1 Tax=Arthrobacter castelli TaxID=271431 RepID=UPI00056C2350|nr:nucleotidyltransferase family protein [Arthrobacter castelli]
MRVTGIVLAAGAGRRLGRGPKALLPYRGRPLVEHVAGVLLDGGCDDVVVVLGAEASRVRDSADLGRFTVLENPEWSLGLASSFQAGVAAAGHGDADVDVEAVMIALVDQPRIQPRLVQLLLGKHRSGRITAAHYGNGQRASHPMVFDIGHARNAMELASEDTGARNYLRQNPQLIDLVDCTPFGDDADVDTAADLHLLED